MRPANGVVVRVQSFLLTPAVADGARATKLAPYTKVTQARVV